MLSTCSPSPETVRGCGGRWDPSCDHSERRQREASGVQRQGVHPQSILLVTVAWLSLPAAEWQGIWQHWCGTGKWWGFLKVLAVIFGKSAPLQQVVHTFSHLLANGYIQYVILMLIWQEHGIFMDQNKREQSSLLIGWRTRGPPVF